MISLIDLQDSIDDGINEANDIITTPLNLNNSLVQIENDLKGILIQKVISAVLEEVNESASTAVTSAEAIGNGMTIIQGLQNRILEDGLGISKPFNDLLSFACISLLQGIPQMLLAEEAVIEETPPAE